MKKGEKNPRYVFRKIDQNSNQFLPNSNFNSGDVIIKKINDQALTESSKTLKFIPIKKLEELESFLLEQAIKVYQSAFARQPYNEIFSEESVKTNLQEILNHKGDLIFGLKDKNVISLAGGYQKPFKPVYFIEELAVMPSQQGQGYGKSTLKHLLSLSKQKKLRYELRTNSINEKAISLYEKVRIHKRISS